MCTIISDCASLGRKDKGAGFPLLYLLLAPQRLSAASAKIPPLRERPKTLSPLRERGAGIFLVSLSFPLSSCHSGLLGHRFRLSGAVALRLRFSPLRMRGRIIGLTMIMVERCHPEWEGGSVSCFCRRGPLRLRFSALRTGPSTPLCCAQDRHFDSALLRSGQALRLRFAALRMRVGPFDAAQDSFACWGGKIIGRGHENEKTLPSRSVKRSAKCKTPRLREPRCQFCEWWSKGRVGRFLKRGLAVCYRRTGCSSECGGPVSGPPTRSHQTSC